MPRSRKTSRKAKSQVDSIAKDFVKKKTKLGKRPRVSGNDTDTRIKSRKIILPAQASVNLTSLVSKDNAPAPVALALRVSDALQKVRHTNARARADSLNTISNAIPQSTAGLSVPFWIRDVLDCVLDCLEDNAKIVRKAAITLVVRLAQFIPQSLISFEQILVAKLCSTLSSFQRVVRFDGAEAISTILEAESSGRLGEVFLNVSLLEPLAQLIKAARKYSEKADALQVVCILFGGSNIKQYERSSEDSSKETLCIRERFWYNKHVVKETNRTDVPAPIISDLLKSALDVFSESLPVWELAKDSERLRAFSMALKAFNGILATQKTMLDPNILRPLLRVFPIELLPSITRKGVIHELNMANIMMAQILVHTVKQGLQLRMEESIIQRVWSFCLSQIQGCGLRNSHVSNLLREIIPSLKQDSRRVILDAWLEAWQSSRQQWTQSDKTRSKENRLQEGTKDLNTHYSFLQVALFFDEASEEINTTEERNTTLLRVLATAPAHVHFLIYGSIESGVMEAFLPLVLKIVRRVRGEQQKLSDFGKQLCKCVSEAERVSQLQRLSRSSVQLLATCLQHSGIIESQAYFSLVLQLCKNAELVATGVTSVFIKALEWDTTEKTSFSRIDEKLIGLVGGIFAYVKQGKGSSRRERDQLELVSQSCCRMARARGISRTTLEKLTCGLTS